MAKKTDRPGVDAHPDGSFSVLVLGGPYHLRHLDGKKITGVKNTFRVYPDDPKDYGNPFAIPDELALVHGGDLHFYELVITTPPGARLARMAYVHNADRTEKAS